MDLEREMESLAREARKKLDAESEEAAKAKRELRATTDELDGETESAAERIAWGIAARIAVLVAILFVASLVWALVVAPLVKLAMVVLVLGGLAWFVWKLLGGGGAAAT